MKQILDGFGAQMYRLQKSLAGSSDQDARTLRALMLALASLAYEADPSGFRRVVEIVVRTAQEGEIRPALQGALYDAALRAGIVPKEKNDDDGKPAKMIRFPGQDPEDEDGEPN